MSADNSMEENSSDIHVDERTHLILPLRQGGQAFFWTGRPRRRHSIGEVVSPQYDCNMRVQPYPRFTNSRTFSNTGRDANYPAREDFVTDSTEIENSVDQSSISQDSLQPNLDRPKSCTPESANLLFY